MSTPVVDLERKRLTTHSPRGAAAIHGCAAVFICLFGLPFMAGGVLLTLIAQGRITTQASASAPPSWVVQAVALVFLGAGLFLFVVGVRSWLANLRHRRAHAQHPQEPWRADGWSAEGAWDRPRSGVLSQLMVAAFLTVFLGPFNYFVFLDAARAAQAPFFAKALVGFFDFILVLVVLGILTSLWHRVRYGRSWLAFGSFPFFTGQTLSVRLRTGRTLGPAHKLVFTLRCVEEWSETRRTSRGRSTQTLCDQLWAAQTTLSESWAFQEGEIPLSFRLPAADFGTQLGTPPVRYWELEVSADTPGLDFGAVFPVPVYSRPPP